MTHRRERGLTLVEILIAMLVFAVGALALAASSGAMVRQISSNAQRSRAYAIAQTKDENVHASLCTAETGSDRVPGIISNWQVTSRSFHVTLDQTVTRSDSRGLHTDVFRSGAPCE